MADPVFKISKSGNFVGPKTGVVAVAMTGIPGATPRKLIPGGGVAVIVFTKLVGLIAVGSTVPVRVTINLEPTLMLTRALVILVLELLGGVIVPVPAKVSSAANLNAELQEIGLVSTGVEVSDNLIPLISQSPVLVILIV